jgi:hypothetical protein
MIAINPPVVMPYAPATKPIAFVDVLVQRDELLNRTTLVFICLDAKKVRINVDQDGVPQSKITPEQLDAFVSSRSRDGNTLDQEISRRALPIVESNLGLKGTVQ